MRSTPDTFGPGHRAVGASHAAADGQCGPSSGFAAGARILLIHHAAVDPAGRMYGGFDAPLSAAGRAALEALRARTPVNPAPAALYTSTLTRAREVAALLGRAWRLEPRYASALGDMHCGRVEGMRIADVRRVYPAAWARYEAQVDDHFRWPDGETYRAFRARILACLSSIAAKHRGERVAVVTHAGLVSQVLGALKQRPPAAWQADRPDPLSGTEVTWNGVGPLDLLRYNEAEWL